MSKQIIFPYICNETWIDLDNSRTLMLYLDLRLQQEKQVNCFENDIAIIIFLFSNCASFNAGVLNRKNWIISVWKKINKRNEHNFMNTSSVWSNLMNDIINEK